MWSELGAEKTKLLDRTDEDFDESLKNYLQRSTRTWPLLANGLPTTNRNSAGRIEDVRLIDGLEFRMISANRVQGFGLGGAPGVEEFACFAFGDVEMGPLRDTVAITFLPFARVRPQALGKKLG